MNRQHTTGTPAVLYQKKPIPDPFSLILVKKIILTGTLSSIIFIFFPLFFPAAAQMIFVDGGSFTMGSSTKVPGDNDESPAHPVSVSPFKIDAYEVSYAQYDSCVKRGGCTPAHYDDGKCIMWTSAGIQKVRVPDQYRSAEFPVVCVSWYQASQYCRFKGKKLPTEAQWEYAALAGTDHEYSWGNQPVNSIYCSEFSRKSPAPRGCFRANEWGIYDMSGNVWEWVQDRYEKDYYTVSQPHNPPGPVVGRYRVIRGGGWYSAQLQMRIKNRQWLAPEVGEISVGFRCVQ